MAHKSEHNFYALTARSEDMVMPRVAEQVYGLCRFPDRAFSLFERGPRLYCSGRITPEGERLLQWHQTQEKFYKGTLARCLQGPVSRERLHDLTKIVKRVTVRIALGPEPVKRFREVSPGLQTRLLDGWRTHERRRLAAGRAAWLWRTVYINPATHTADDVHFQLALILLQERMVPEAQDETMRATMVDYLCTQEKMDVGTAHLVLERFRSHFAEPIHAHGIKSYIKSYRSWTRGYFFEVVKPQVFHTRHVPGEGDRISVNDSLVQFVAERLPATRSTVYGWAQEWALERRDWARYDDNGGLCLTSEGVTEACKRLMPRALTQLQITRGKNKEAARKFTARHKLYIQAALTRGERLENIVKALFGEDAMRALVQLHEDGDS